MVVVAGAVAWLVWAIAEGTMVLWVVAAIWLVLAGFYIAHLLRRSTAKAPRA